MSTKIFLSFFLVFSSIRLMAQYPNLSSYSVQSAGNTTFEKGDNTHTEVPPWMIGGSGNWRTYFMNDGQGSFSCSAPYDMISNSSIDISNNGTGPFTASRSQTEALSSPPAFPCPIPHTLVPAAATFSAVTTGIKEATSSITMINGFIADAASGNFIAEITNGLAAGEDWKRNYYGIYSAQYLNHPTAGPISLGIVHCENKNTCLDGGVCGNTVNADDRNSCTGDWGGYNGLVSVAWIPNTAATNYGQQEFPNEIGPIAWPSTGYLTSTGAKATTGLRHPTSVIYNNYLYVFYADNGPYNFTGVDGRYEGIKVVRAPLSSVLDPTSYQTYYRDASGNESWSPSLPPGFTKENIQGFWNVQGARSTDLMGDNGATSNELRFSVAHVNNTNYFIGVEEFLNINDGTNHVALRWSSDLVHWTARSLIIYNAADWNTGSLHYPIFLSSDGWSNNAVDLNDFYVLGTGSVITSTTNKYHIYNPTPAPMAVSGKKLLAGNATSMENIADTKLVAGSTGIFPNPNHGVFQLSYTLNGNARVQINVFDVTGRLILAGSPVSRQSGNYRENIDISPRSPGIYLVELWVNGSRNTYKVEYN